MPKLGIVLSFAILWLVAVAAGAQGTVVTSAQAGNGAGTGTGSSTSQATVHVESGGGMVGAVVGGFIGHGLGGVRNLPFSADVIDETDQFLADGNHIHHENHGKIFRDSEGRSRTEMELGSGFAGAQLFVHVMIMDPVANSYIILNPQQKTAMVHHFAQDTTAPSETRPVQPMNRTPQKVEKNRASGAAVLPGSGGRQHAHEDLGTTEIEGFTVKGSRLTSTMDAGTMGNDKPMTSTNERWFSEDLKTDLLIKSQSPQAGQHVHKLVNIHTGDPDPLLFRVPADYTVKETAQN